MLCLKKNMLLTMVSASALTILVFSLSFLYGCSASEPVTISVSGNTCGGALEDINESLMTITEEYKSFSIYTGSLWHLSGKKGLIPSEAAYQMRKADENVWSFLQGPRAWANRNIWSGEWSGFIMNGKSFGSFGCGFCCMANIYNTLSGRESSPVDLYERALTASGYAEVSNGTGAIGWGELKKTLKSCGMDCDVYYAAEDFEEFKCDLRNSASMIALVWSAEDNTFWQDTPGHYVNIWNYRSSDDTVFLCEPGSPTNNRARIPAKYVYNALKMTSKFQYLIVKEYDEKKDTFKCNNIDENWVRP